MPDWFSMDWAITLGVLGLAVAFTVFASHMAGRPYDIMRPKRIPWRILMILSAFLAAMMLVHIFNLVGYETGVDKGLIGRF